MTKTETVKLLAIANAAFPNMQISEATASLWNDMLGDLNFQVALAALKKLIYESPYPPTIADIWRKAVEITSPASQVTAVEAWGEVLRAIKLYGYYKPIEALNSLSPLTRKVVQQIGWQEICMSEEPDVIRGQFRMMYEQMADRQKQDLLIPDQLKKQIQAIVTKAISDGADAK